MAFLIPACLIVAGIFIWQEKKENYVAADILKGIASLCFVLLGTALSHYFLIKKFNSHAGI